MATSSSIQNTLRTAFAELECVRVASRRVSSRRVSVVRSVRGGERRDGDEDGGSRRREAGERKEGDQGD